MNGSIQRISAMLLRHLYVLRGSWPRIIEMAYWPTIQMILWGFVTKFFMGHSSWVAEAAAVLIAGVLLWDVLFRSNLGVSLPFIEEMWSRNFGQLFVSPLRPYEFITALLTMSAIRTLISVTPAALLALPLYGVWVFDLGPSLMAFFANLLIMGWWIGLLVSSLIMRFGLGAESLCWLGVFLFAPLSAIYYPVDVLPSWLQSIALLLPGAHVFEGMRTVLFEGYFDWTRFWTAVGLNIFYIGVGILVLMKSFEGARKRGSLLQQGE